MKIAVKSLIAFLATLPVTRTFNRDLLNGGALSRQNLPKNDAMVLDLAHPPTAFLANGFCRPGSLRAHPSVFSTCLFSQGPISSQGPIGESDEPHNPRLGANNRVQLAAACNDLISSCKTLSYGVGSPDGKKTEMNYAPYSRSDGCSKNATQFYLLGSPLASSTRALIIAAERGTPATLLFMRPEDQTAELYARERATVQTDIKMIERESEVWREQVAKLADQFGEVVETLTALPDFCLFELTATKVRYVKGFAQAYTIRPSDLCRS